MSNRQIRRLQEAEERRRKKENEGSSRVQRKAAAIQGRAPVTERKTFVARIRDYLHEVRVEMRKVTWPTREQMIAFTAVTLVTSIVLTGVTFLFDFSAREFVLWLIGLRG